MATQPSAAPDQLVTFQVAGTLYAVPAAGVSEVVRAPRLTHVPHAPPALLGLGNLRGAVLPVVSLGILLDEPGAIGERVIVLAQDPPVGVMVERASATVDGADGDAQRLDLVALVAKAFNGSVTRKQTVRVGAASVPSARANDVEDIVTLLAFEVSGQEYALPLAQIEEVTQLPSGITLMPKADAVVIGTIGRAGRLLPLLSLRHLLGLPATVASERPRVVIARIGSHRVGLVADAVNAILRVRESAIDPVPAVLTRGSGEARIQAICRLDEGKRLVSVLATHQLLRGDLTSQLQSESAEGNDMAQAGESESEQFLVFRIGDQDFGLPIGVVEEIAMRPETLTKLPRSPAFVEGVMNLRGQVVPVIDQSLRFRGESAGGSRRRVIIVSLGGTRAGFAVDAATEVLRVPTTALRDAPELGGDGTRVFDRVANLDADGRMILIVQPQELLDRAERDLIDAMAKKGGAKTP